MVQHRFAAQETAEAKRALLPQFYIRDSTRVTILTSFGRILSPTTPLLTSSNSKEGMDKARAGAHLPACMNAHTHTTAPAGRLKRLLCRHMSQDTCLKPMFECISQQLSAHTPKRMSTHVYTHVYVRF